jgi:hypothetical protein
VIERTRKETERVRLCVRVLLCELVVGCVVVLLWLPWTINLLFNQSLFVSVSPPLLDPA